MPKVYVLTAVNRLKLLAIKSYTGLWVKTWKIFPVWRYADFSYYAFKAYKLKGGRFWLWLTSLVITEGGLFWKIVLYSVWVKTERKFEHDSIVKLYYVKMFERSSIMTFGDVWIEMRVHYKNPNFW